MSRNEEDVKKEIAEWFSASEVRKKGFTNLYREKLTQHVAHLRQLMHESFVWVMAHVIMLCVGAYMFKWAMHNEHTWLSIAYGALMTLVSMSLWNTLDAFVDVVKSVRRAEKELAKFNKEQ